MEKKFTIRLSERESANLSELRDIFNENTDSKTIKKLINQHKSLRATQLATSAELNKVRQEYAVLKEKVNAFKVAFKDLVEY